jgi:hypothetical protein
MSYGATVAGAIHEAGISAGKILSGAKVDHSTTAPPRMGAKRYASFWRHSGHRVTTGPDHM